MSSITKSFIAKLKKKAKTLRKDSPRSLTQIQDELAREFGYLNWRTLISYEGRGVILVIDAEEWFRLNYTLSVNHSNIYPTIEEPHDVFEIIASQFDFALDISDGGRFAEMAENLALEGPWISESYLAKLYSGE
ncbi:hypothetical protein [Psychrosphaera algicola]|uniref:Uncharacterized protein n=1 Tax=Psychrosphaera algicola TaxID=3023714 RepID=A0ABT5FFQ3_9GAMM|nr:hypothetical protein [Psychrosphaera sp. G1-22]MDC2890380.1 hypothetical protein [Psychrosphaera sp. G1-22]